MNGWHNAVYKVLADMELGSGHTSGIVPIKETQNYFGKPLEDKTHRISTITIEFWFGSRSDVIKTNVNYFRSPTHRHIHLTGKIMPTYMKYGAVKGDILVFWKSRNNPNRFKVELIKRNSDRWNEVSSLLDLRKKGGVLGIPPPSLQTELSDTDPEYQTESDVDEDLKDEDFPPEKRTKERKKGEWRVPPRDKVKGDYVLKKNGYKCQIDPSHKTFLSNNGRFYMEKHHLIPMAYYEEFEYNIDDINNLVSLCPTCHRMVHFGKKVDVEKAVELLWNQQKEKLRKSSIFIELADLKKKYSR